MTFATTLNEFCESLNTTSKDIAKRCDISASALSRYRKGERTPDLEGDMIARLARGIAAIQQESDFDSANDEQEIRALLEQSIRDEHMRGLQLCERLDLLMKTLSIRNSELAAALQIDPSYLSRIRSKQRIPADQIGFARKCAQFSSKRCFANSMQADVIRLIGIDDTSPTQTMLTRRTSRWLLGQR